MDKNQYFAEFLISLDHVILETMDIILKDAQGCYGDLHPLFVSQITDRVSTLRSQIYRALEKVK